MPPWKKEEPAKDRLTETSIRLGKTLGRSTAKIEATGRKAQKAAGKLVKSAVRTAEEAVEQTVKKAKKLAVAKPTPPAGADSPLFQGDTAMTVEANIGFLAGDIYAFLKERGPVTTSELARVMQKRGNTLPYLCAAVGWLSREYKIRFADNGNKIALTE